jgi:hypothetical protein
MAKSSATNFKVAVLALGMLAGFPISALGAKKEVDVKEGCRLGAIATETNTAAHHIAYDDNENCSRISARFITRCLGDTLVGHMGMTNADAIERKGYGCDAISTVTYGYNFIGEPLGDVEVIQK